MQRDVQCIVMCSAVSSVVWWDVLCAVNVSGVRHVCGDGVCVRGDGVCGGGGGGGCVVIVVFTVICWCPCHSNITRGAHNASLCSPHLLTHYL